MADTGAEVDIGATTDTGGVGCTDAAMSEATDIATRAAMNAVTAAASMAAAFEVVVVFTVAGASTAAAGPTVEVGTKVVDTGDALSTESESAGSTSLPAVFLFLRIGALTF
jgi:hypothetical protein